MLSAIKIVRGQFTVYQIVLVLFKHFFLVQVLIVIDCLYPGLAADEILVVCVSRARVCRNILKAAAHYLSRMFLA